MPLDMREVEAALVRKGFQKANSSDRRFVYWTAAGQKSRISTMISHGRGEISDSLLGPMARQMRLTNKQLREFVRCTIDRAAYEALVGAGL